MATVVTTGRVAYLKLATNHGFVGIRREMPTGINVPPVPRLPRGEILIIWFGNQSRGPRALFTAELSKALAHGLRVRLTHEDDSAFIEEVTVEAPFEGSLVH